MVDDSRISSDNWPLEYILKEVSLPVYVAICTNPGVFLEFVLLDMKQGMLSFRRQIVVARLALAIPTQAAPMRQVPGSRNNSVDLEVFLRVVTTAVLAVFLVFHLLTILWEHQAQNTFLFAGDTSHHDSQHTSGSDSRRCAF